MNRREVLEWVSRTLAACVAAIIGLPGIRFVLGSMQADAAAESQFQRVMRLKDLVPGRPMMVPILGQKQDAWTRCDQQVIGRVFLVRDAEIPAESTPADAKVHALSSICPHMGCQVQCQSGSRAFVCPCHRATFAIDGSRQPDPKTGERNHAPRDMDQIDCHLAKDQATGEWWVEVKYEKHQAGAKVS
jgi:menaquinol-cytochrome c reductase iron-sulfur subunit